jgi:hypothetical protein
LFNLLIGLYSSFAHDQLIDFTARYSFSNRADITIEAYQKDNEWVINSFENKESYFKDAEIMKSLFVGLSYFVK